MIDLIALALLAAVALGGFALIWGEAIAEEPGEGDR